MRRPALRPFGFARVGLGLSGAQVCRQPVAGFVPQPHLQNGCPRQTLMLLTHVHEFMLAGEDNSSDGTSLKLARNCAQMPADRSLTSAGWANYNCVLLRLPENRPLSPKILGPGQIFEEIDETTSHTGHSKE